MLIGQDIAVLGAGIAGLSVAQALAQRGARVTVYERASAIREVGAGIQITPNGAAVLKALGLDASQSAMRSQGVRLVDGYSGREVLHLDFARYRPDLDFWLFHRADLIALLEAGARSAGVDIRLGSKVASVDADADGVDVRLEGGQKHRHAIVLGADGLHSIVRPMLNGPAAPFFTGQTAWRAVIEAPASTRPEAMVHMARGRHVVCYPLRGGTLMNIVAAEERSEWTDEGWHLRGEPEDMMRVFASMGPGVRALLGRVETVMRWGLFRHEVAGAWSAGRMAILGDAAHPTLPFLAQGANMALEDAWVLADCLGQMDHAEAFAAYQTLRRDRVYRVIAAANANARNYHLSGAARLIAHGALRIGGSIAPRKAVDQFAWLYAHDVTA